MYTKKEAINDTPFILEKLELFLLFTLLLNYYLLLVSLNISRTETRNKIKEMVIELRHNNKLISSNTTDKELNNIISTIDNYFYNVVINLKKNIKKSITKKTRTSHTGGFYFRSLEDKGEQPITGADLSRLLDEVQQFFYNAKQTEEGKFLRGTDTILSMLRGDVNQFKGVLQYQIFPKYYSTRPLSINWNNIYDEIINQRKWEDIPDYLLAYQSYLRSRDEYLVEKGLKPPSVLQKDLYTGFYNKMANSLNDNIYAFQTYRRQFQGQYFPITTPI